MDLYTSSIHEYGNIILTRGGGGYRGHTKDQGRVLLKVVNPNVDVNVDVDVTYVNFAFY